MEDRIDEFARFHEACHAVMAHNLGMSIDWIKMHYIEGDLEVCAVSYKAASSPYADTMEKYRALKLLVAMAGQYAVTVLEGKELRDVHYRRFGASEDLAMIQELGGRYWRSWIPDIREFMGRYHEQVVVLAEYLKDHKYVKGNIVQQVIESTVDLED
jgi:hypothetical protein